MDDIYSDGDFIHGALVDDHKHPRNAQQQSLFKWRGTELNFPHTVSHFLCDLPFLSHVSVR